MAVNWFVHSLDSIGETSVSKTWATTVAWTYGTREQRISGAQFERMMTGYEVPGSRKLALTELLLDACRPEPDFEARVNEAADRWRVGLRLEGGRFVPVESLELHTQIVTPTLQLLRDPRLAEVEKLYRKACDRVLERDYSGAVTVISTAIEEMLRAGGASGTSLQGLSRSGQQLGWFGAGVQLQIEKLEAFRVVSDAHYAGTDQRELGMLSIHIGGTLLLYPGSTGPFSTGGQVLFCAER